MSLTSKIYTFVFGMLGCTVIGVSYGLVNKFLNDKANALASHKDDPKCEKGRPHCIDNKGNIHIDFFGGTRVR